MTTPPAGAAARATAAVRAAGRALEPDPVRPASHFRPPGGWMNDPNGTVWHRGWHHLFYQHNPYGDAWGDVHWGHARSRDLVRWEHLPVALAPSTAQGEAHCFSGSAWVRPDGTPLLFYSSFPADTSARPAEQWAVLCDDAMESFERWEGNPVLSPGGHGGPELEPDWRDPFVFARDGRVFMILGAVLAGEGAPAVLLYEAGGPDLLEWGYRGVLHRGDPREHTFFECPNLVPLGERHLLVWSDHRPVEWLLGDFDPDAGTFRGRESGTLDRSPSFYATGRVAGAPAGPVLVGWVRGWEPGRGWNGCLGLPRVLRPGPADGAPVQRPPPAVEGLRDGPPVRRRDLRPRDGATVLGAPAATALEVRARLAAGDAAACGLRLRPARDAGGRPAPGGTRRPCAEIRLRPAEGAVEVAGRSHPLDLGEGARPVAPGSRPRRETTTVPLPGGRRGTVELRLFWDRSLLELFLEGGREVCTRVMAGAGEPVVVEAFAESGRARFEEIAVWGLEEIW